MASQLLVLLLLPAAFAQTLQLCDGSASQIWAYNSTAQLIVHVASGQCLSMSSGCCSGETVRAGDVLQMATCSPGSPAQSFAFPNASHPTAPNAITASSTQGEPEVETGYGQLVADARGAYYPRAQLQLYAYSSVDSSFIVNGSATGASLMHNASGLCLSNVAPDSSRDPVVRLAPCKADAVQPLGDFFSSQLFTRTSDGFKSSRGACLSAWRVLGSVAAMPGDIDLIGVTCTPGAPSQTLVLGADENIRAPLLQPAGLVVDPGSADWWGAPTVLQTTAGSPTARFAWTPDPSNATYGRLVHVATGMCMDANAVPAAHGCLARQVRNLPYCNASLDMTTRVSDFVGRLTPAEAIGLTGSGPIAEPCVSIAADIPRLDIPRHTCLVEVTSMASSTCAYRAYASSSLMPANVSGCSTSFPAGMIMAGAFNATVWREHGRVVGDEIRGLNNIAWVSGLDEYGQAIGLSGYGPNVNQPRDPRNGRNGELLTEDPFLGGAVATQYILGMQRGGTDSNSSMLRMLSYLKHYTAYSLETNRFGSVGNVSTFDLWDTYLPQYEAPMLQTDASGTMCSYFSMRLTPSGDDNVSYIPSCANPYLLTTVVRQYWNRPDATHLSDCGAVWNMAFANHFTANNLTLAAAASINAGMDMNSNTINPSQLGAALEMGLVSASTLLLTAGRIFAQRVRVGQFDPLEVTPPELLALGAGDIGTQRNLDAAAEGVAQGTVLLRNSGVLPLKAGLGNIAVLGPTGSSTSAHMGDFYGNQQGMCTDGSYNCIVTFAAAVAALNGVNKTTIVSGVAMNGNDSSWGQALDAVSSASVVLLTLGTDRSIAGEGNDRSDIGLPPAQSAFALAVLSLAAARSIPVVLVLIHNLPVSFDELVQPANATYTPVAAIVDAWAPTISATTVANAVFGVINRWGKSVLTVYPHSYQDSQSLFSFDMSAAPGRSYKYYNDTPLIAFGEGQSYSTFAIGCSADGSNGAAGSSVNITCVVNNTVGPDGDEVLQVYHRPSGDIVSRVAGSHPLPLRALVGFSRISVAAGGTSSTTMALASDDALTFVNEVGARVLYAGLHYLDVSNGNGYNTTFSVQVPDAYARVVRAPPLPPAIE